MYPECAVATYKAMLQRLYPDFKKKLAFARLMIDEVPDGGIIPGPPPKGDRRRLLRGQACIEMTPQ